MIPVSHEFTEPFEIIYRTEPILILTNVRTKQSVIEAH